MPKKHTAESFWARLDKSGECWKFIGSIDQKGYGSMTFHGRHRLAHVVAWELTHGRPRPLDMQIDHLCRVRDCCRPEHLELVTPGENTRRTTPFRKLTFACKKGHPWKPDNEYFYTTGGRLRRKCKICNTIKCKAEARRRSVRKGTARPHLWTA